MIFPLLKEKAKKNCRSFQVPDCAWGIKPDAEFKLHQTDFQKGDAFDFYTDGITETQNPAGEEYGERKFRKSIQKNADKSGKEICKIVTDDVFKFMQDMEQMDDITMVVAKIR